MADKWSWWVGPNQEIYHTECGSREEALRIARTKHEGAYICEARKDKLELADYFDANGFLEQADENAYEEANEDGDPVFEVAPAQQASLQDAVRAAIRKWQADHGLTFIPWRFTAVRNEEFVPPEEPAR